MQDWRIFACDENGWWILDRFRYQELSHALSDAAKFQADIYNWHSESGAVITVSQFPPRESKIKMRGDL